MAKAIINSERNAALPDSWFPLRPHEQQYKLWTTNAKFIHVAAGRGSGKTEVTRRRQVRWLPIKQEGVEQPLHGFALPTYSQARRVAWEPILRLIPKRWISKISQTEMYVETVFGSRLYVLGLDKPERAEGVQWTTFVIDESSDQRPGVFDKSILPALSHNCQWCARIGVPKRSGPGAIEFRRAWEEGLEPTDLSSLSLMWPSSDIVDPEIIADAKKRLDPQTFDEQYNASWLTLGGGVFYAYDDTWNVSEGAVYRPGLPVVVGCDFNVNPMSWVLGHFVDGTLMIFDEIYHRDTNTRRTLAHLKARYGGHKSGWFFTGDASGRARRSSADVSDYAQIHAFDGLSNSRVIFPRVNPSIATRLMTVNSAFLNSNEERRLLVSPRCVHLRRELAGLSYKPGTREIDIRGNVGHLSDGLGYLVMHFLPIRLLQRKAAVTARILSN